MSLTALLRPLGLVWIFIGLAAALSSIAAMAMGEGGMAPIFGVTASIGIFPGLLLLIVTRGVSIKARAVEALGLALFVWITAPLIAAFPFYLSGIFAPLDAAFEAYSAVTTTGAILEDPEGLPRSLVFWRSLLSWLGGYATILLAAAVFAALDRDAPAIRRSVLLTTHPDNVFSHLGLAASRIAILYTLLTSFIWLALLFSGQSLYVATTLSMSALSTGGYSPVDTDLSTFLNPVAISILVVGCSLGALNIAIFWDALQDKKAFLDPDIGGLGIMITGLAVLYFLAYPGFPMRHFADAVFAVTTSGYSTTDTLSPVPVAALFAALIGGAAASTSGGVKVSRILLLWRRMEAELSLLADPSSVARVRFRDRSAPDRALIAIWSYVLAFAAILGLGGVLLSLNGLDFESSFSAVAAALANSGPLYELSGTDHNWHSVKDGAKIILIPIMILGRLEVLAALAAIWAIFSRK